MTPKHHVAGLCLIIAAFSVLVMIPLVSADVRSDVTLPFGEMLKQAGDEKALVVFAGYPGCAGVCPTTMNRLAAARRTLDGLFPNARLGVVFINLHLDATDQTSSRYAASFHPEFRGFSITSAQQGELKRALAQSGSRNADELSRHRGNVYLYIQRNGKWKMTRVYSRLPAPQQLVEQLQKLLFDATTVGR